MLDKIKYNYTNRAFRDDEDVPVIDYIKSLQNKNITLLEVACGECRFVSKLHNLFPEIKIVCLDINKDLVHLSKEKGFTSICCDATAIPFSESFDVVHCSHLIEHLDYPKVIMLLNELLRVCSDNGVVIIRSPLMYDYFYYDIDHIRPYPPQSIINYFSYTQQQSVSKYNIEVKRIWYRTFSKEYHFDTTSILYIIPIISSVIKLFINIMNSIYSFLWNLFRCPSSKPNGYVMILSKIKEN